MVQAVSPVALRSEVALLFTPFAESGYRNVYFERKDLYGNKVYQAHVKIGKVKYRIPGSCSTCPSECAKFVIGWYKQTFGASWKLALMTRWKRQDRVLPPILN